MVSGFSMGLMHENLEKIIPILEKNGIETRPLAAGSMGEQPFWIDFYKKQVFPNATKVHHKAFFVPLNQDITLDEINYICKLLIDNK